MFQASPVPPVRWNVIIFLCFCISQSKGCIVTSVRRSNNLPVICSLQWLLNLYIFREIQKHFCTIRFIKHYVVLRISDRYYNVLLVLFLQLPVSKVELILFSVFQLHHMHVMPLHVRGCTVLKNRQKPPLAYSDKACKHAPCYSLISPTYSRCPHASAEPDICSPALLAW